MVFPIRSICRLGVATSVTVALLAYGSPAPAQEGASQIRDTEIEEILQRDAEPILRAAGIDPKTVQIVLVGSKDLNALSAEDRAEYERLRTSRTARDRTGKP